MQAPVVAPIPARPVVPATDAIAPKLAGKVKPGQVANKLTSDERVWSDNVMRALKLKSKSSQTRVLAGAVASSELIQRDATRSAQDKQSAQAQLKVVRAAGDPPWKDTRKAMAATAAKVELDLLSIPGQRQIPQRTLGPGQNATAMQTYFLDRKDADGNARTSFVLKPASKWRDMSDQFGMDKVAGIPDGGEVIREAMSGRAAQTFMSLTGLDVNMPESHVISLDATRLPGAVTDVAGNGTALCSVQEFSPGCREFGETQANPATRQPVDREQVAGLAVFDLMTLNTDRHGGNILIDPAGKLVPIDHGASFPDIGSDEGAGRLMTGLGGTHNALLSLPEAHEPMSPNMLKKLRSMKSSNYGAGLRKDRADIGAVHPSVMSSSADPTQPVPMLSDASIDLAEMAARFTKLSAQGKPPLSPAGLQIAFASNADVLQTAWAANAFDTKAKEIIGAAAQNGTVVKQVCLSQRVESDQIADALDRAGWFVSKRGGAPGREFSDPALIMAIFSQNPLPQAPRGGLNAQLVAARQYLAASNPATLTAALLTKRRAILSAVIPLLSNGDRNGATASLNGLPAGGDAALDQANTLLARLTPLAVAEQTRLLQVKITSGAAANKQQLVADAQACANGADPIGMAAKIQAI